MAVIASNRRVALKHGHGSVAAGPNVRVVTSTCIYLAQNARLLAQALALGEVRYLSEGEIERSGTSSAQSLGLERAWATWVRRVSA